eukprot:6202150-Pleurochrysis_carterae.AAC.2
MEPYDPLDADEIAALEAQTDRMRRRDEWSEEELEADAQAEAAREAERRKLLGADELEDDEDDESGQMETVKMTTPLGNTLDNLEIFPGPPVPAQVDWTDDARPLYVFLGMYPPRMMPTPPLVESFVTWLNGTADLGLAGYLLSQQQFDLSGLGTDYTDAELEEYDARAADDVDAEDVPQMLEQQMQFVNANLVVTRHKDIEAARQWAHDDPLNEHNGRASTQHCTLPRWRPTPAASFTHAHKLRRRLVPSVKSVPDEGSTIKKCRRAGEAESQHVLTFSAKLFLLVFSLFLSSYPSLARF